MMILDFYNHFSQSLVFLALVNESHAECLDGLVLPSDLVPQLDNFFFELMYLWIFPVNDWLPL